MQELNNASNCWTTLSVDTESCKHQPVYFGVVNINIDERTIGSVDIWRCAICKKKFCEEKQLGIEEIAETVGMPKSIKIVSKLVLKRTIFQGGKIYTVKVAQMHQKNLGATAVPMHSRFQLHKF